MSDTSHAAAPALTPLPALLAARERLGSHGVRFSVPADWQQGRTTFGGLLSVLAVQAMSERVSRVIGEPEGSVAGITDTDHGGKASCESLCSLCRIPLDV